MPRPPVCVKVGRDELRLADGRIEEILRSEVKGFTNGGAYIPVKGEYAKRKVFLLILEDIEK